MESYGLTGYTLAGLADAAGPGARGKAVIPREGFPSSLLEGLNQRMPAVTPPESYPATLRGVNRRMRPPPPPSCPGVLSGLNRRMPPVTPPENYPATLAGVGSPYLEELIREAFRIDAGRVIALLIGYFTYTRLPVGQAFLATMAAPWAVRSALGQTPVGGAFGQPLIDGLEGVVAGLIAIGGGGYF